MENGPFIVDLIYPLKIVIFHSYVKLPEGNLLQSYLQGMMFYHINVYIAVFV